jgi:hypothetical protein
MKAAFKDYINSIGITGGIEERVQNIISQYEILLPAKEVLDIFVSDYFSEDGNRNFDSLWLFFDDCVCEAKNFILVDNFDCAEYRKDLICWWSLDKKDFDLISANDNSRISLSVHYEIQLAWNLKAARNNCMKVIEIIKTRLI